MQASLFSPPTWLYAIYVARKSNLTCSFNRIKKIKIEWKFYLVDAMLVKMNLRSLSSSNGPKTNNISALRPVDVNNVLLKIRKKKYIYIYIYLIRLWPIKVVSTH